MSIEEILFEAEEGMEKAVAFMTQEFAAIRTGRFRWLEHIQS